MNPFAVKTAVLPTGERLPLLCSRETGVPLFEATVWSLTELRARSRSSSTIQQALRAVMVLNLALERLGVDLDARLSEGKLLDLGEVDEVARQCRTSVEELATEGEASDRALPSPKVVPFEKLRMRVSARASAAQVDPNTAAIRIRYIRDYLNWRATLRMLRLGPKHELYFGLKTTAETVVGLLNARIPASSGRNSLAEREGLSKEAVSALVRIVDPVSPDNPWNGEHLRERNALIVRWLLDLGVRRGELLGVRISDINFQTNEVLIARRADNPEDPRKNQPNTKTQDRLLPLDDDLATLTRRYIVGARRRIPGARRHDFLIVADGTGAPLTLGALNKLFEALRLRCPELPQELSPHACRHTWNDHFSILMDERKVPEESEKKMRARLMGWSETSNTAVTYTRRHVKDKARKASLALQGRLHKEKLDEK
jgi:integrase